MSVTSVLMPPVATWHWLAGWVRRPRLLGDRARAPRPGRRPGAVLFDRDGTLVVDVPYNGDPGRVALMPGAREAVERVRAAGVPTAVVSNQSGVGRGYLRVEQVEAVNRRVEELLGPLGPWLVCVHEPGDGCGCRKPAPGLIQAAAGALGVEARDCVVIGDIGADVEAATAAGARAVLVPTPVSRVEELLGPLGPWMVCVHGPGDGCRCRKPGPGLIEAAAGALGVEPGECVVIGDIGADVEAARAAGARAVLVPTAVTRAEEVAAAPEVAADLVAAVELVLGPAGGEGVR